MENISEKGNRLLIAVDVDGTLINYRDELNKSLINHISKLKGRGFEFICWSSGGKEYAREVLNRHKIRDLFSEVMGKPFLMVDDQAEPITVFPPDKFSS